MANRFVETILNSYNQNSPNFKTFNDLVYCSIESGSYSNVIEKKGIRLLLCALRTIEPDTEILFPRRQNEAEFFFIFFKKENKILAVSMKSACETKRNAKFRAVRMNGEKNGHLVDAIIAFDTIDNVSFHYICETTGRDKFSWPLSSNR
jgi:hypothetical protein